MPVLLGNKIYFHMPKTGGTWVSRYMREELQAITLPHWGGHASVSLLPDHLLKDKVLFGTKRNPWSWYASWYVHALSNPKHHPGLKSYGKGSTDFADVLRGVTAPNYSNMPRHPGVIWEMPDSRAITDNLVASKVGLYSWVVGYIYARKCELVEPGEVGQFLGVGDITRLPENLRRDSTLTDDALYTPELREIVWEADGAVATRLGYDKLK